MELSNNEEDLYPLPKKTILISLYLAHRPGLRMKSDFSWVKLNGDILQDELPQSELPGKQGWFVDLGYLAGGLPISLEWELRTKTVPPATLVMIGVFRNRNLRNRTELIKDLTLTPYQGYFGNGVFTV